MRIDASALPTPWRFDVLIAMRSRSLLMLETPGQTKDRWPLAGAWREANDASSISILEFVDAVLLSWRDALASRPSDSERPGTDWWTGAVRARAALQSKRSFISFRSFRRAFPSPFPLRHEHTANEKILASLENAGAINPLRSGPVMYALRAGNHRGSV